MAQRLRWVGLLVAGSVAALSCSGDGADSKPAGSPSGNEGGESGSATSSSGAATMMSGGDTAGQSTAGGNGGTHAGASAGESAGGADTGAGGSDTDAAGAAGAGGVDAGDTTPGWLSGSRLRAVTYVSGSAVLFHGWHDQKLDVDCAFALDESGIERCLPNTNGVYVAYRDDKCQEPVLVHDAGLAAPKYAQAAGYTFVCGKGPGLVTVGDKLSVTQLFALSGGSCSLSGDVDATQVVTALGSPVASSAFVATSEYVREPRDARLMANVRVAGDGSREVVSQWDSERNADCAPLAHGADGYACVPDDRAYIEAFFADAGCSTPAALRTSYAQGTCSRAPAIVQNASNKMAGEYFEVGKQLSGQIYRSAGKSCPAYAPPPSLFATFYAVGSAVPFSAFPALADAAEGAGRILVTTLRGSRDEVVASVRFLDSSLDVACNPGIAEDAMQRCLPQTNYVASLFSDDQCTNALVLIVAGDVVPASGTFVQSSDAIGHTRYQRLGAKIATPTSAWQRNGTACEPVGAIEQTASYYATEHVLPTALAPVVTQIE